MSDEIAKITAVVVTYQSERTIRGCLEALRRGRDAGLVDCVVIDNDSKDGTAAILRQAEGWARVVFTGRNLGFGRGCNRGAALASTSYVVFVNPDAKVEPDVMVTLAQFLDRNPKAGIVGPAIVEGEGGASDELQQTGRRPTPGTIVRALLPTRGSPTGNRPIVPGAEPFRTGWVCGAVLMIRTELLRRLGGFDERFFLYWEEMDLCLRAEELGFEVWAVGTATARHVGGASSDAHADRVGGCIPRFYYESRYYYLAKNHGRLAATAAEIAEYSILALRTGLDIIRGRGSGRMRVRRMAKLLAMPAAVGNA